MLAPLLLNDWPSVVNNVLIKGRQISCAKISALGPATIPYSGSLEKVILQEAKTLA